MASGSCNRPAVCTWGAAFILSICLMLLFPARLPAAERLTIGVAANFIGPFRELAQAFERKYSVSADATFTSSGRLYAQIVNGAPFDLFLSADRERPEKLFQGGLAEKPFVYARGRVVLWGLNKALCRAENWQEAVSLDALKRIAIANPQTAPYGAAALQALQTAGLWPLIEKKLVYAESVAQAFQYAHTGTVAAGFCADSSALSKEGKRGCRLSIQQAPDITQAACILKRTQIPKAAEAFAAFLLSPAAERIKGRYGYH